MEALRDRTIKIDIPYLLKIDEEKKIYDHFYNKDTVNKHIAPHTTYLGIVRSCKSFGRKFKARHEHHSKSKTLQWSKCTWIHR